MNKYRMRSDGSVKTFREIKQMHNASLSEPLSKAAMEFVGCDLIFPTPRPEVTLLQTAYISGCEQDVKGNWVEAWEVKDKFSDQVEDGVVIKTKAEQEVEFFVQNNTSIAEAKKREIREAFAAAASADVTDLQGVTWRGGLQSAQSIAGAVDLAQVAGLAEITLRDAARQPHVVDMATGLQVAAEIAMAYQSAFQKKEDLMLQIESIDLKQATAEAEINSIAWENQNA